MDARMSRMRVGSGEAKGFLGGAGKLGTRRPRPPGPTVNEREPLPHAQNRAVGGGVRGGGRMPKACAEKRPPSSSRASLARPSLSRQSVYRYSAPFRREFSASHQPCPLSQRKPACSWLTPTRLRRDTLLRATAVSRSVRLTAVQHHMHHA